MPEALNLLEGRGVPCYEADVRFAYRYLIDRGIRGAFEVHGHFERHRRHGLVLRDPEGVELLRLAKLT